MYYISYSPYDRNHLEHFGIPGMKWGQRRFQNEDGSYTEAGKRRYGIGDRIYEAEYNLGKDRLKQKNPKEYQKREYFRKLLNDKEVQNNKKLYKAIKSASLGYADTAFHETLKTPLKVALNRTVIRPALKKASKVLISKLMKNDIRGKLGEAIVDKMFNNKDLSTDVSTTQAIGMAKAFLKLKKNERIVNKYLAEKELNRKT